MDLKVRFNKVKHLDLIEKREEIYCNCNSTRTTITLNIASYYQQIL